MDETNDTNKNIKSESEREKNKDRYNLNTVVGTETEITYPQPQTGNLTEPTNLTYSVGYSPTLKLLSTFSTTQRAETVPDKACSSDIEKYLLNSPSFVPGLPDILPSLEVCKQLCEESSQCMSLTLSSDGRCSHYSTPCSSVVASAGSTTVRFSPRIYTANWALASSYGRQCDSDNGESLLEDSSGPVASLSLIHI